METTYILTAIVLILGIVNVVQGLEARDYEAEKKQHAEYYKRLLEDNTVLRKELEKAKVFINSLKQEK